MTTAVEGQERSAFQPACQQFAGTLAAAGADGSAPLRRDLLQASPQWQALTGAAVLSGTELGFAFTGIAEAARVHVGLAGQLLGTLALRQALAEGGSPWPGAGSPETAAVVVAPDEGP